MAEELCIMVPKRARHFAAICELATTTFYRGTGHYTPAYIRDNYFSHSHYDWRASRIGLIGENLVTHFGVWDFNMRVGSAQLRVAAIGAVATHADFRKRNLMMPTASCCVEGLRAHGYDVTMLFGIPNFYHRFGYVPAWGITTYILSTEQLPAERPRLPVRAFASCARADTDALYNEENAGVTGTAIRPTYRWGTAQSRFPGLRWLDDRGNTAGYVVYYHEGETLHLYDSAGDVEQRLRVLGKVARQLLCKEVRIGSIPHESALATRLRWMTCREDTHYSHTGGAMIRTVNLNAVLRNLAGELSRRLAASPLAGWHGQLTIADPREEVTLAIAGGQVLVAPAAASAHRVQGGEQIAQLLIGKQSAAEVSEMAGFQLSGDAALLLDVLFPAQHPTLAVWDSY